MRCELSDICVYRNERISTNALNSHTYVSTENMLPDKGGITDAASLPTVSQTSKFIYGDTLVSNIRPYFKKIWFAEYDGGCSNDVLVFSAKEGVDPKYLYYVLANDSFFAYSTATSKGTKMPRGDKTSIMQYQIEKVDSPTQKKIAAILSALDEKIAINREINENLERQAASIFAGWLNTCTDFSTIGDMAHNILDYSPVASEQIRLLNSSDVTEGVFPVVPLVPNKDLKGHFKKRFKFGDILYSEIRPRNHHYGFVLFDASDYIASTRLMVIRAIENKVSPAMLYQYLLLPEVEAEFTLKTESRSGTFPQGNYADMASIRVPYSPTDSQVAISETLTQIRYTIAQNQLESQRLAELRDTLLPKLMSGEIDVSAVQL